MNSVLTRIFTATGDLSSGRIGYYIGLITVVIGTLYDTYMNKRLDFALAGLLLSAGTVGYGITKSKEGVNVATSD